MTTTIEDVWKEFLHPEYQLCGLCGNSGVIDTRGRAISGAGYDAGILAFCLCPNGRACVKAGLTSPGAALNRHKLRM